jgi:uncharacterized protein (TIRG00374 family)
LAALVWHFVDPVEFLAVLKGTSPAWLGASIGCFLLYQWWRMRRTALLLAIEPGARLYSTMCLQGAANDLVLPAGTGEAALVYLLKRWHGAEYHVGLASLVVGRVVDLALFGALFVALIAAFGNQLPDLLLAIMAALAGILLVAGIVLWVLLRSGQSSAAASSERRWRREIARQLQAFSAALRQIHTRRIYAVLVLQSAAMWVTMYLSYVALMLALNATLSFAQVLLLYILVFPVDLTPVKGVANFGTHEGVWFLALQVLGLEPARAATLSFASHILILVTLLTSVTVGMSYFIAAAAKRVGTPRSI